MSYKQLRIAMILMILGILLMTGIGIYTSIDYEPTVITTGHKPVTPNYYDDVGVVAYPGTAKTHILHEGNYRSVVFEMKTDGKPIVLINKIGECK